MNKIIAIAVLALRTMTRSRLFVSLMAVLAAAVVLLPLTVKGDGTLAGEVTVLLHYTLGLAAIILGAATLWSACGLIAYDIRDKQIQLVVAKPVHRYQIWLGKWLGLLLMNAILLSATGLAVYLSVRRGVEKSNCSPEERAAVYDDILTGRRRIVPLPESVDEEIHRRINQMADEGKMIPDMPHYQVYAEVKKRVLAERSTVAPGQSKKWTFAIMSAPRSGQRVTLRFSFASTFKERKTVSGTWFVGTEKQPGLFSAPMTGCLDGIHKLVVPAEFFSPGAPVVVTFQNAPRGQSNTAIFDINRGMEVLVHEAGFKSNLVRSLVMIFCHMMLLSALGLTAGALFSFPVAVFVSCSILIMSLVGHYFTLAAGEPPHRCGINHGEQEVSALQEASGRMVKYIDLIIAPTMGRNPLPLLADGILVSYGFMGRAFLLLAVIYPGVMGIIGVYFLNKRELAMPM